MNKKEVLEIKKQFRPENCCITRIANCYVDHEKNRKMESKEAFLSLPEEEAFKYFEIFKKTLSGGVGKNLLNLIYTVDAERERDPEGKGHELLMMLRNTKLEDPVVLNEFYEKVIQFYECAGNYYVILIHGIYDVPGRASDGEEMEDASDTVYDFVLCSICPVNLSPAGLAYNAEHGRMEEKNRDWIVDKPDKGFLFPSFNDRATDVHEVLYYTKKTAELQERFIEGVLGAEITASSDEQKTAFTDLVREVLGEGANFEIVREIYENISNEIVEHEYDPDPLVLTKKDLEAIFRVSGVENKKMEVFDRTYDECVGKETVLQASNIAAMGDFKVELAEAKISTDRVHASDLEIKEIDGRKYITYPVKSMKINEVMVKA